MKLVENNLTFVSNDEKEIVLDFFGKTNEIIF